MLVQPAAGPKSSLRHPASFRDPAGQIVSDGHRVLRGLRAEGVTRFEALEASGLLSRLIADRLLVDTRVAQDISLPGFERVLEHERIPFIAYPYEWPFSLAKAAALHHLNLQLRALSEGFVLIDASAYNVQFVGTRPVFIDLLSLRPYREGELWYAHRQFCEHFLNPLLMQSELGLAPNAWLRGALEGVDQAALASMLPWHRRLSPKFLAHVYWPARQQSRSVAGGEAEAVQRIRAARLPRHGYRNLLLQLRDWIEALKPRHAPTVWEAYGDERTYASNELNAKRAFIRTFVERRQPGTVIDIGCNDGEFLSIALAAGARYAVGLDVDHGALAKACRRSRDGALALLPLYQDLANPSPPQGWRHVERDSITQRARADAVFALALEHHLALGRNIPLDEVVAELVAVAPAGVIEFVQKDDPTVVRMLALKGDLFPDYHQAAFEAHLRRHARIVGQATVSAAGRTLYAFESD